MQITLHNVQITEFNNTLTLYICPVMLHIFYENFSQQSNLIQPSSLIGPRCDVQCSIRCHVGLCGKQENSKQSPLFSPTKQNIATIEQKYWDSIF